MKKELIWTGLNSYDLTDFNDGDVIEVQSDTQYYSSLLRFLTLLKRAYNVELELSTNIKQVAELTGFNNLIE